MRSNNPPTTSWGILSTAVCTAIAAFVVLPLIYLVLRASELGLDGARSLLMRTRTVELALNTTRLTVLVTVGAAALAVLLAWLVTRCVGRGRAVLLALLTAPLAIPSYVSGFVWTRLVNGFEGLWAAVVVLVFACYPLVLLPVAASLIGAGRAQEDVARSLGRSALAVFFSVTLRRLWPACVGGSLLVALYAISDFGGPAMVRYEPFTVGIYNAYNGTFDRSTPALYGSLLALAAVVLVAAERAVRRDVPPPRQVETRPVRRYAVVGWLISIAVVAGAVAVPVLGLIREIVESRRLGFSSATDALAWLWPYFESTLLLSAAAGVLVAGAALPIALHTARPHGPGSALIESATHLGYALPGITVALAMVFLGIRLTPQLYGQMPLLLACYVVLFLPLCTGPTRQALDSVPAGATDVARSLGASPLGAFVRVRMPLAAPGLIAGTVLAALSVAKELPATLMLAPVGTSTLATQMWSLNNDLAYGRAAIAGLTLIVVASVPTALLTALMTKERR